MSLVSTLDIIKQFLEEKVAPNIKLQKASEDIANYELVNPNVFIGWIPPNGFLPEQLHNTIPCLLVGVDETSDDGNDGDIPIRISAAVYSPGLHKSVGVGEASSTEFTPDFQGYIDLLNLMDRTAAEIIKTQIMNSAVTVQYPVKTGMYQEQPYPYWYGWITFSVKKPAYPRANIAKLL